MDVFMLIVTIIGGILCVVVNLYTIAIYCHKQDNVINFTNVFCKILIMLSLIQIEFQPLFLLFDVTNSRQQSTEFTILWAIVYFSILVNIGFFKPIATSMYEADEEDHCCKRVLWTIIQVVISVAVFGVFVGVGWVLWGYVFIPIQQISVDVDQVFVEDQINQVITARYIQIQSTIPCFLVGLLCLLGYPVLALCGACGTTILPFSLIKQFMERPKWRRTNEAKKITEQIKKQTVRLIKKGDHIRRAINRVDYIDGWFAQRKKNQELQSQLNQIEGQLEKHRDLFELFKLQLNMVDVNPWVFIFKLALGIICLIFAPIWLVQILLGNLVFDSSIFLDKFLVFMEDENASFVSIAFMILLNFYLISVTLKGVFFVSASLPFFKIHPMIPGKTWLNSFLFQLVLTILASTSMVHLLVITFPQYLRGADLVLMMSELMSGMLFVGVFIRNKVFVYIYLIMSVLGLVFSFYKIFCTNTKSDMLQKIEEKRKKLFGKDKENDPITIQMTEMHLKDEDKEHNKKKKKKVKLVFA